jgi:hypothetical protein
MILGDILKKLNSKKRMPGSVTPPPQTSVFLMMLTAIIAMINLKIILPEIPDVVLITPGIIPMVFGAFYKRWIYISLMIMVSVARYYFGVTVLDEDPGSLLTTILVLDGIVIFVVEVERLFWKETQYVEKGLRSFNDFVNTLEKTLLDTSRMLDPHIAATQLMELCVNRFEFSGAYLYHHEELKRDHTLTQYSYYENKELSKRKVRLMSQNLTDIDIDIQGLLTHLFYKSISVCSSNTPNDFLNKLREDLNVKTIIAVGLEYHGETVGCIFLVKTKDHMNYDSFDDRLIMIVRSMAEILFEKSLSKQKRDQLEKRSYAFTKIAIEDIYSLIEKHMENK